MEKEKSGHRIPRQTAKMPTAASASSALDVAAAAAASLSPACSSIAVDSSSCRPSSPTTTITASSTAPPVSSAFPQYHYSRDELLSLKNSSLSTLRPKFLTPVHELLDICLELDSTTSASSRSAFDEQSLGRSSANSKRHVSLGEQRSSGVSQLKNDCDADAHIILVPQRSSFGTGCHVAPGRAVNSPETKRERNRRDGHRIGSGRIQISEKYVERDLHDHRVPSDRDRDRNDRWYDRCGNGTKVSKRDYDGRRSEAYRDGRHFGDAMRSGVEPEWFTEGPLSQSDTIELHGFESLQKSKSASKERLVTSSAGGGGGGIGGGGRDETKTPQQSRSLSKTTQVVVTETSTQPPEESKAEEAPVSSLVVDGCNEARGAGEEAEEQTKNQSSVSMVTDPDDPSWFLGGTESSRRPAAATLPPDPPPPPHPPPHQTNELDFDAFFNADSIPGLNDLFGLESEQVKRGSRFQQWFHFSSHGNSHCESRRSSLTDEFGYINDIIYGHNSPLRQMSPPPPNPPLPPAAAAGRVASCASQPAFSAADKYCDETESLLEMLQRANADGCCVGTALPFNGRRDATAAAAADSAAINYCLSSQGDVRTDARDVEAGLKAILSGAIFANSPLLSGLSPSMAASLALAGPPPPLPLAPPFGAKVLLAEELEAAHLVAASAAGQGQGHETPLVAHDIYSPSSSAGNSRCHHRGSPPQWSNSGPLSFCSLPVLPVGTKVTLLSDLEAGLKGLSVVNGNHVPGGGGGIAGAVSQPLLAGSSDCHSNSLAASAAGRPASSSHGGGADDEAMTGQLMSSSAGSVFAGRSADLAAYKKLLGLIVEPLACQTAINNSLPIVTSPTSISMSNLEANQPNNSLANNQRDFIQRYLLQQQQLKMLHHQQPPPHHPPPPPEGAVFAVSQPGLPAHLLPPSDHPHLHAQGPYLSPGLLLTDPLMPSGLLMAPPQQQQQSGRPDFALSPGAELHHHHHLYQHNHHQQPQHQPSQPQQQQHHQGPSSSCGYDRRSGLPGLSLNLTSSDDLSLLPSGLSSLSAADPFAVSYLAAGQSHGGPATQHMATTTRPRCHAPQMPDCLLPLQQQHHEVMTTTSMPIGQLSSSIQSKQHLLLQESAKQAIIHQASLNQHHQQQQMARMTHLALHDSFGNSTKLKPCPGVSALSPHPVLAPHLTLQPPPPVSSHPSPVGLSMLGHQSLLQQPPQSPRRAPSPIMFGNKPPMNLTAPLPVHLGPMTPILSPTLSPNTLQVTQTGSNLSSPVMRVPSPQELSGLAQSILQNALIKKQLEEQKERFIRRQQERNKSPKPQAPSGAGGGGVAAAAVTTASRAAAAGSGVFLDAGKMSQSFLPTSVLRKMASSKADERMTRPTDDASSSCSGEKNVPLLKVVKPDEDCAEDENKDNNGLTTIVPINTTTTSSRSLQFVSDDRLTEISVKSSVAMDDAVSQAHPGAAQPLNHSSDISSSGAKQLSQTSAVSASSAASSTEETGLLSQATTRRLLGQGLMNIASSPSSAGLVQLVPLGPASAPASHPNNPSPAAAAGFASSGRQIKGKKMPDHHHHHHHQLSLGRGKPSSDYHHQLQQHQQQQQQQQLFAGVISSCAPSATVSSSSNSSRGAAALSLHAVEMAKLVDQQRKGGGGLLSSSSSSSSPMPPFPAPSVTTQFLSTLPAAAADNAPPPPLPFGLAPLPPTMLLHQSTTFGVNAPAAAAAASNALLLQRLAYPNLQRGGLSSVNHLNFNQMALMQAVQLQQHHHQQQQQQQQLWNRNAARSLNSRAGAYPPPPAAAAAFAASSLPHPSGNTAAASPASSTKPRGGGGGGRGGTGGGGGGGAGVGDVNGLKTASVGSARQMRSAAAAADNDAFTSGTNLHQQLTTDFASRSSEATGIAPTASLGTDAGRGRVMASAAAAEQSEEQEAEDATMASASCRSDVASSSDVGTLAKWFGSDVFSHHLPPPLVVASAGGHKVLTVDEIEGWQRAVGES